MLLFSGTVWKIIVYTVVDFLVVVLSGEGNKVFCALPHHNNIRRVADGEVCCLAIIMAASHFWRFGEKKANACKEV